MGNLASVKNAFTSIGAEAEILSDPEALGDFSHIVLPGVGAFGDGISNLRERAWIPKLEKHVLADKTPCLGICLGMQLLAEKGTEGGDFEGLGWMGGSVVKFDFSDSRLRIPHIGWNDSLPVRRDGVYREGFGQSGAFYFVHSYLFVPSNSEVVDGVCDYGCEFAASVSKENIWGVQFHPEKSQKAGLNILKNFLSLR
jgi:glutamine amidotransferase